MTKFNIKPNFDVLKARVNSANNNSEIGFETKRNTNYDNSVVYTNTNVVTNGQNNGQNANFQIQLSVGGSSIGGGHTHPIGSYPVPSYGDLRFLRDCYEAASSTRQEDVFYIAVCKDQNTGLVNTYCLQVESFSILDLWINNVWDDPKYSHLAVNSNERIDEIHKDQAFIFERSGSNYEKSFLEQFASFGISLYQATDDTMTNWSKLSLGSTPTSTITKTPCN